MLSTLSKFRILARMVYPQYVEFENWLSERGDNYGQYVMHLDNDRLHISYNGFGSFSVAVNGTRLNQITLKESWLPQVKAIYVFWQAERYAKGKDSLFAPSRKQESRT